jgi:hypothetical protein
MGVRRRKRFRADQKHLPTELPNIGLRHGEAIWLLTELGFRGNATQSTFHEYVKSLRKLGAPFKPGEVGFSRRGLANYSYYHLMELSLVLALRVYNAVPDSVLLEIIRHRATLRHCYRRAYLERASGIGAAIDLKVFAKPPIRLNGAFLDLQMGFAGGRLVRFGPPRILSAYDAFDIYAKNEVASRAFLPMNLSLLAEHVVETALRAPLIRAGRPSSANLDIRRRRRAGL